MTHQIPLKELAEKIGVREVYPEEMEEIYLQKLEDTAPACNLELIDSLQQEHNLFGDYYEQVRSVAEQVNQDEMRSLWVKTASAFVIEADEMQAQNVPEPTADHKQVSRMLPLFVLLPSIPLSIAEYRRRKFTQEEMNALQKDYSNCLRYGNDAYGYPCINEGYYSWLVHICKVRIFRTNNYQFEVQKLPSSALFLKHRQTGELRPVMMPVTMVGDGKHLLGVDGYKESADTFQVTFREDEDNFYGHGVTDCVVSREQQVFPKAQWECLIRPGEYCLGLHITKRADISPGGISEALAEARKIALDRYGDLKTTEVFCESWLLDPQLAQLAGSNSKMASFMQGFCKYPTDGSGTNALLYVFGKETEEYESLAEDTTLQRNMKKLYLDGGHVYFTAGLYCK